MPARRFGKVRHMLKDGRAKVVCDKPFTIPLQYEPETHVVQEVVLGSDPGKTKISLVGTRLQRSAHPTRTALHVRSALADGFRATKHAYGLRQYRRHDRALIQSERPRTDKFGQRHGSKAALSKVALI